MTKGYQSSPYIDMTILRLVLIFWMISFNTYGISMHPLKVEVTIDETMFQPSYKILGEKGGRVNIGKISIDSNNYLSTIEGVKFTLWEISPNGELKGKVNKFTMRFTGLSAYYLGSREDGGKAQKIDPSLIYFKINGNDKKLNEIIEMSNNNIIYNNVEVYSRNALPKRNDLSQNRISVSLIAIFEGKII